MATSVNPIPMQIVDETGVPVTLSGLVGATGATGATGPQGDPGVVNAVVAGTNVTVDSTDPANPVVSAAGGAPGGSDTQVQFNASGTFAGSSGFVWTNSRVGIGTNSPHTTLEVQGSGTFGVYPLFTPAGAIPNLTMWSDIANGGTNNAFGVLSNSDPDDGGVIIKPNMFAQYGGSTENIGGIQGAPSSLSAVANLAIQGEGGNLYVGAMADDGTAARLQVAGDIHCTGKLTSDGGVDPPYMLFDARSRAETKARVLLEVPAAKRTGAAQFWNPSSRRMEYYIAAEDKCYDLMTGNEVPIS